VSQGLLTRLAVGTALVALTLALAAPYLVALVHDLFVPVVVLLLLIYIGRVIWWYTGQ
jgi:hypothetical protein